MNCPYCGSSATGYDGSDVTCVCRDCGAVLEGGILQNEPGTLVEGSQNVGADINFVSNGTEASTLPDVFMKGVRSATHRTYVCKGKQQGLKTIKELFKHLSVAERHLIQEAIDLYMSMSSRQHYKFQNLQKKEILAGICVIVVCRNHEIPVTFAFISKLLRIKESSIKSAFFKFKKQNATPVKQVNIIDLVDVTCGGQTEECVKFTKDILSVVKKSWIMEGRTWNVVVMAANYFAWQALDYQHRCGVTLKEYSQQQGWTFSASLAKRCKELGQMFCTLASELPWLASQQVGMKQVIYYMKDIVTYHRSLMNNINSEFERNKITIENGSCLADNEKSANVITDCYEDSQIKVPSNQFEQMREPQVNQPTPSKYEHIVLPSSFVKTSSASEEPVITDADQIIASHPDIDSEFLGEADIKDEDLDKYIKTPDEVDDTSLLSMNQPLSKTRNKH